MTYLLRLNLDIKEKNFKENLRFQTAVSTIRAIQKRGQKVVIVSPRGRPASPSQGGPRGRDKTLSFRPFTPALSRSLNSRALTRQSTMKSIKVVFLNDF